MSLLLGVSKATAQQPSAIDTADAIHLVEVGFAGQFKVGSWTPIRIAIDPQRLGASRIRVEVQTIDGDGVRVTHVDAAAFDVTNQEQNANGLIEVERKIRIGRLRSNLVVRVLDEGGLLLASRAQLVDSSTGALPSTHGLIVGLGPEIGFRQWLSERQKKIEERVYEYVHLTQPDNLLADPAAYESIDLMVITVGDGSLLAEDSGIPWPSIARWVQLGGVLLINTGEGGEGLEPTHPLASLLPGTLGRSARVSSSVGVETFVSANDQLLGRGDTYQIMPLENPRGKILAYERIENTSTPLVIDTTRGMGRVLWMGADLSAAPLKDWSSRPRLLGRLVETLRGSKFRADPGRGGSVKQLGYSDLAGQLRAALDRYRRVSLVTFTGVAIVVVAFILMIGPFDYWLVSRVLKRPEWTWITSGIVIVALTAIAALGFNATKGNTILANQLELIDVDATTGQVRGSLWVHLYSPRVQRFDLTLQRMEAFQTPEGQSDLVWQGLSGSGLGGMDQVGTGASTQGAYRISHTERDSSLQGIAVQVASTRGLAGRWSDRFASPIRHRLYLDHRNNSLHGDFTNPFSFTLDQAVIFYDNWAYIINEDVQPGETISIEGQATERTIEALLARRTFLQGTERSEPWDPTATSLTRITEMLSFHEAVGGRNYTKLTHQLHGDIDWSTQIQLGNAVLYARCSEPVTRLRSGDQVLEQEYDERLSILRVIFPVNTNRAANN